VPTVHGEFDVGKLDDVVVAAPVTRDFGLAAVDTLADVKAVVQAAVVVDTAPIIVNSEPVAKVVAAYQTQVVLSPPVPVRDVAVEVRRLGEPRPAVVHPATGDLRSWFKNR
jgi:hypothetical protein